MHSRSGPFQYQDVKINYKNPQRNNTSRKKLIHFPEYILQSRSTRHSAVSVTETAECLVKLDQSLVRYSIKLQSLLQNAEASRTCTFCSLNLSEVKPVAMVLLHDKKYLEHFSGIYTNIIIPTLRNERLTKFNNCSGRFWLSNYQHVSN